MLVQLIRNATLKIHYHGRVFLTDPVFSNKHAFKSFVGTMRNPLVDLPCSVLEIMRDIDAVLFSHLHIDHFDAVAEERLPQEIPIFCQPTDTIRLLDKGFQCVTAVEDELIWKSIKITRTTGEHGTGDWSKKMGEVSGFVFRAENEPTIYWAGDTILCDAVISVINKIQPDIIITHSGGARFFESGSIIMDDVQTVEVCKIAPKAKIIAVHMEALDHCSILRADLRALADKEGIEKNRLLVLADGESIEF